MFHTEDLQASRYRYGGNLAYPLWWCRFTSLYSVGAVIISPGSCLATRGISPLRAAGPSPGGFPPPAPLFFCLTSTVNPMPQVLSSPNAKIFQDFLFSSFVLVRGLPNPMGCLGRSCGSDSVVIVFVSDTNLSSSYFRMVVSVLYVVTLPSYVDHQTMILSHIPDNNPYSCVGD